MCEPGRPSGRPVLRVSRRAREGKQMPMKHKMPPPVADINVTPMVDVMLVMLIIFMVITPMLSKGVSVDLVRAEPDQHGQCGKRRRHCGCDHA